MHAANPTLIVFSHGNGFPAATYGTLFSALEVLGYAVCAVPQFGHDPRYPVTTNWPHLVRQHADFVAEAARDHAGPLVYVGHSFGGYVSLMSACLHARPAGRPVDGVVLLDAPLLGGWRAWWVRIAQVLRVIGRMPPGAVSRRRRQRWPDRAGALAHFGAKPVFAAWHPEALADYVAHGTVPHAEGGHVLAFDRDVETTIYNTLPHNMPKLLRRHPPPCPVAYIGGRDSREARLAGLDLTHRVVGDRFTLLDGTHLFPMERPIESAAAVHVAVMEMMRGRIDNANAGTENGR